MMNQTNFRQQYKCVVDESPYEVHKDFNVFSTKPRSSFTSLFVKSAYVTYSLENPCLFGRTDK